MGQFRIILGYILVSVLLWMSWPPHHPLLIVCSVLGIALLYYLWLLYRLWLTGSFIALLIWNALTTWWISLATLPGAIFTVVANSFLYWIFTGLIPAFVRKELGRRLGTLALLSGWLTIEFIHFHWELRWPWLTLGNIFASAPEIVQWYELVGLQGGSLWILIAGMIGGTVIKRWVDLKSIPVKYVLYFGIVIFVPISYSLYLYWSKYWESWCKTSVNVVIIQPNVDPYDEKFYTAQEELNSQLLSMAGSRLGSLCNSSDTPVLIVTPETALPEGLWMHELDTSSLLMPWYALVDSCPLVNLILGASLLEQYDTYETPTTRFVPVANLYYDAFNSAILINSHRVEVYHKELLVPGVETLPYHRVTSRLLGNLMIDLGGISGSLGTQENHPALYIDGQAVVVLICYESVFPEYIRRLIHQHKGSLIAVITNDGWWGNTAGYKQHFLYARLQAITFRRWVVRSANTGISGIIDPAGRIVKRSRFWEEAVLDGKAYLCLSETPYLKYGNVVGRVAVVVFVVLLVVSVVSRATERFRFHPKKWRL